MAEKLYGLPFEIETLMKAPPEMVAMAEGVRNRYHRERLDGATIAYAIEPGAKTKNGRVRMGHARGVSKYQRLFTPVDFIITFNWRAWGGLDEARRIALVDHELCHCVGEVTNGGEIRWGLVSHDIEDFVEIFDRHGFWTSDWEAVEAVSKKRQKVLFGGGINGDDPDLVVLARRCVEAGVTVKDIDRIRKTNEVMAEGQQLLLELDGAIEAERHSGAVKRHDAAYGPDRDGGART